MIHSITRGSRIALSSMAMRLLAVLLPAAALGATELDVRSARPTTRPIVMAPANAGPQHSTISLPTGFETLNKRSIFSRNGIAAQPPGTNLGPPEAMFALRGIVFDDVSYLAFVEDVGSHRTMQLKPGDVVAGGRIGQITVDDVGYEASGKTTQVRVGQNLMGMKVPPMPAAASRPAGPMPGAPVPEGMPQGKPPAGPIYDIGPNGQRVRNLVKERGGE
jgi:hypothetical protein